MHLIVKFNMTMAVGIVDVVCVIDLGFGIALFNEAYYGGALVVFLQIIKWLFAFKH